MTSHFAVLAIDAHSPDTLADFWCEVLGWEVLERDDTIVSLGAKGGGGPTIDLLAVADQKVVKNRLHLDLRADGATTQGEELERLVSIGATRVDVGQAADVSWVVLADPEGNEFCLL